MKTRYLEVASIYLIVSVCYGLLALLLFFPLRPITATGWLVWFVTALPIALASEFVGSAFFNRRTSNAINSNSDRLSVGRIAYGVVAMLILLFLAHFVIDLLGAIGGDFWEANFSAGREEPCSWPRHYATATG